MAATYVKFLDFVEKLCLAGHNLNTDTVKIAASNTAPTNTDTTFAPGGAHPPPAAANGYPTGGSDSSNTLAETGGVATVTCSAFTWTATAGGIGPFRYIIAYNDTSATDLLIAYWDYGPGGVTLNEGETFTWKPNGSATTGTLLTVE